MKQAYLSSGRKTERFSYLDELKDTYSRRPALQAELRKLFPREFENILSINEGQTNNISLDINISGYVSFVSTKRQRQSWRQIK
jgi:hypothetical protein